MSTAETIAIALKNATAGTHASANTKPGELFINTNSVKSDEDLMTGYQNGSIAAFDELYARHAGRVYGFILSRLRNKDLSDDVFQTVFYKLHKFKSSYDPKYPFLAWLFTLTRNTLADFYRKRSRIHETADAEILKRTAAPEREERSLPHLKGLNQREELAINLRYLEEKTFTEIAEELSTSANNVRKLISRAVGKMRGRK